MLEIKIVLFIFLILVVYFIYNYKFYSMKKFFVKNSLNDMDFVNVVKNIISKSKWNEKFNITNVPDEESADIVIELASRERMAKLFPRSKYDLYPDGTPIYFSTTHYRGPFKKNNIYIDEINWKGVKQSGLTPEEYKSYVIQHEFGHALGYDHQTCDEKTKTCPIMYQQTRGIPKGYTPLKEVSDRDYEVFI